MAILSKWQKPKLDSCIECDEFTKRAVVWTCIHVLDLRRKLLQTALRKFPLTLTNVPFRLLIPRGATGERNCWRPAFGGAAQLATARKKRFKLPSVE